MQAGHVGARVAAATGTPRCNTMEKQQTYGQGLAENSAPPALFGVLIASLAENLAVHMEALDLTDKNAQVAGETNRFTTSQ